MNNYYKIQIKRHQNKSSLNCNIVIHSLTYTWGKYDLVFDWNHPFLHSNDCVLAITRIYTFFFFTFVVHIINVPNFRVGEINVHTKSLIVFLSKKFE